MYICQATKTQIGPNQSPKRLVTVVRSKTYYRKNKYGEDVTCGQGTEIVRELSVSKEYYDEMMAKNFQPTILPERVVNTLKVKFFGEDA